MQSYYIKPKSFYDSLGDVQPSQPYSYAYGDRPVFEFVFLPNEIAEGDTLVFAVDNDMVFYDNAPENLLHSASCMVVVRHYVTAEEATAGKVQLRIETRTVKFRDVTNGKVRPVEVISGLYRRRGDGDDVSYVLLARGRAFANGIIADYDALPEPITTDEYYTKGDIDGLLGEKADEATLVAHTDNADIHVTMQDKTTWDSKADIGDIGNATVTITQGGETRGSFSVNATDSVTIDLTGGAQADWNETDTTSPAYIQHKPSVYTKTETDALLVDKADKATTYTKTETDGMLDAKANVATTLSGYGIQDAYTKDELTTVATTGDYNDLSNRPSLDFVKNYFTVTAKQADSTVRMMTMQNVIPDIEYSTDGGKTWTKLVFTKYELNESLYFSQTITLANNAKALFRGNNHTIGSGWTGVSRFLFTGQVAVSGKLMSLLDKSCASDTVPDDVTTGVFASLFSCVNWSDVTFEDNMYALVDASGLVFPISSSDNAYMKMFANCKGLTNVPNCFCQGANVSQGLREMFNDSGIAGKVMLGLTGQLAIAVYSGTFTGCTGITKAEILNCIPARHSFLDTFEGCTNLTEITVHFTEWNDSWQWRDAPATGVWRCPKALDITNRGMTGIPDGWTVEYIDEQNASSDLTQADWNETDTTSPAYIQHKPDIIEAPAVAGTVGQVLTKTETGSEWADAPAGGGGEDTTDYLCFTAGQANSTVNLKKEGNPDTITLEYSTDGKHTWTDYVWDTNDGTTITLANANDAVFFRAKNTNVHIGKGWSDYHHFVFGGVIFASGNVMSLLDKTCTLTEVSDNFCFVYTLSDSHLYSAPKLTARKLTGRRCYARMFYNCKNLTEMPDLPAVILSEACYDGLFYDCTSLVGIKNIPMVPMANSCFSSMFENCTSLRKMPELPATALAPCCYERMFSGCKALEDTTVLPATTLPEGCYSNMFQYCKSLKKVPQIKATSFYDGYPGCLESMFYGCTNLIDGDFGVPIDITKSRVLFETFNLCTSLEKAPSFTGTTVGTHAFTRTFKECTSLHYIKPSWTTWNTRYPSDDWFENASKTGIFDCPSSLDTTTYVPTGWTVTHGANNPDIETTSAVEAMTTDIYTVCPSSKETGVITVSSALTLNAYPASSTDIAYAEIVLDVATGATVTAGNNITLVDTPTAGKRNICVCRWSGGVCKLYVTIVEDLPQA